MAQFLIVAAKRIVGVMSGEPSLESYAYYDYRGSAKKPEVDAKDQDYCGYVAHTKAGLNTGSEWTVRVSKRQPPAYQIGSSSYQPETLSYRFFASGSGILKLFPPALLFIERKDLDAFVGVCRVHQVSYHVSYYADEVAVTPPSKDSVAA